MRREATLPVECAHCGWENRLSAAYCGGCGRSLPAAVPPGGPVAGEAPPVRRVPLSELAFAHIGVTLAFAVAAFVRFYRLGDIPDLLHPAEEAVRRAAAHIIDRGAVDLWLAGGGGQPAGLAYLIAVWSYVAGDSATSIRLLSAASGLATLGLFYLLCREVIGRRAAVLGSLLLSLSAWHLVYSRLAMPVVLFLLLELSALYLLLVAFRERQGHAHRRRLLVLAGVAFGAAAYLHNAFFLLALVVLLLWAREFLAGEHPLRVIRQRALAFIVPALILALPYLAYLAINPGETGARVRAIALTGTPEFQQTRGVTEQTRHVLGKIVTAARTLIWSHGADGTRGRLLDPVTALLAAVGMAAGLWRWRERGHFFMLALASATLVAVALTRQEGTYGRLVVALPAVFAYSGYSLHWLLVWMRGRLPLPSAYGIVAALIAIAVAYNLSSFYERPFGLSMELWAAGVP